jgi:hypothetical protein
MANFLYPHGAVYIFENTEAQRVKVGMTAIGVNNVADRLSDINDMWLGRKVTCQICGRRCVNIAGQVPHHIGTGSNCPGGNALPLEKDVAFAELHVQSMKNNFSKLSGAEKASVTRRIKTLEKRIDIYRHDNRPVGEWAFRVAFYTDGVAEVESHTHKMLAEHLDSRAPFGEVFRCSVSVATEAIESAITQLGVLHSVKKKTHL